MEEIRSSDRETDKVVFARDVNKFAKHAQRDVKST